MKAHYLNIKTQKFLMIALICFIFSLAFLFASNSALAALTLASTSITSDGVLTLTPATSVNITGTGTITPTAGSVKFSNGSIYVPNGGDTPGASPAGTIFLGNAAGTTFQPILYRDSFNAVHLHGGAGNGAFLLDSSNNIAIGKFLKDTVPNGVSGANAIWFMNQMAGEFTRVNIKSGDTQGANELLIFLTNSNVTLSSFDASGQYATTSRDLGDGLAGPFITLGRNTNATNTGAGSINFQSKAGTAGYVWQDAAGKLRIHTSAPTNALDTAGVVVGDQTSTRETKQDIQDYEDYDSALSMVRNAPLHTFKYKKDVLGYGSDSPLAKTRLGYIADEVDPMFMVGNSIDQVSVNGLLIASVKALDSKIEATEEKLCAKKSDGSEICLTGDQLEALLQNIEVE